MPTCLRGLLVASVLLPAPVAAWDSGGLANTWVPGPEGQTTYEEVISIHFNLPPGEARLLLEEGIRLDELPVVLVLARERGLAPSVVISRRLRAAAPTTWVQVAAQMNLGAAVFHLDLADHEIDDGIRRAADLYRTTPRDRWNTLQLTDEEIVTLANVRVLSRGLGVEKGRVLQARAETGSWPAAAELLAGRVEPAGSEAPE